MRMEEDGKRVNKRGWDRWKELEEDVEVEVVEHTTLAGLDSSGMVHQIV